MRSYRQAVIAAMGIVALSLALTSPLLGAEAPSVEKNAEAALKKLYASQAVAEELGGKAKAILVFPNIFKAGFLAGAHYGEGVLFKDGKPVGRYSSTAGSFGLQAGVQVFGYAMFLMTDKALDYLDRSDGWELGIGPSLVAVNTGVARSITTTTIKDDVYAFIFNQQGLMAGLGLQGSKITKVK
ncbi:MAG TPA: lipid-binding SYLF domain-containing protein [Candidatus Binatia bacterium]|nr:lipid-binding SYLF domain-containing protein [Candidatus Binatia bacterium]